MFPKMGFWGSPILRNLHTRIMHPKSPPVDISLIFFQSKPVDRLTCTLCCVLRSGSPTDTHVYDQSCNPNQNDALDATCNMWEDVPLRP